MTAIALTCCCLTVVAMDDDIRRAFIARLRRALEMAGLTDQQAAIYMGLSPSRWSDQCAGRENMSMSRLMRLPAPFWRWFALLMVQDLGLPLEVKRSARVAMVLSTERRMARMRLQQDAGKKETA